MARTDTLTHYLTDIADAIREKTGSSDPIQASSFDTAIENLPSGGGYPPDWSEIGYPSTPDYVMDAFDYAKEIYDNWDSSRTSMVYLYNGDKSLKFIPLVDTSNVTNMMGAFRECTRLIYVPLLDTSNVTTMATMFYYCSNIKTIPLLDTSKVTDMGNMLTGCYNLLTIPQFDTSNVTNMSSMLINCSKLTAIPQFNTNKVTNMNNMFSSCENITTIPQFNTSNVTNMSVMFSNCPKLISVPLLDAGSVLNIMNIFSSCRALENLGGFKDLGKAYLTSRAQNYSDYTLNLSACNSLTHESLMNVINNLYDIKTKGCKNQKLQLGSTNLAKLTAEEIAIATNKGWNVV